MLRLLIYLLLIIIMFIRTIFITLWIMLVSDNTAKAKGQWYEWVDYIIDVFNLKYYDGYKDLMT